VDAPVVRFHDANTDGDYLDSGDNILYYCQDANWNVTAVVSASGSVVERYMYAAYGKATVLDEDWEPVTGNESAYANEILYAGYRHDPESGMFQVRNRNYHPTLGRWIERDGGYVDGMSLYQYCRSNPAGMTDPTGLEGEENAWTEQDFQDWLDWGESEDYGRQWTDRQLAAYDNYNATMQDFFGDGDGLPAAFPGYVTLPSGTSQAESASADTGGIGDWIGTAVDFIRDQFRYTNERSDRMLTGMRQGVEGAITLAGDTLNGMVDCNRPSIAGGPNTFTQLVKAIQAPVGSPEAEPLYAMFNGAMHDLSLATQGDPEAQGRLIGGLLVGGVIGEAAPMLRAATVSTAPYSEAAQAETQLYRVFGGKAEGLGNYYTTVDPGSVPSFRAAAGLYTENTGQFVLEGTLSDTQGVSFRIAAPGPGGIGGGLPEVFVPKPQVQINIIRVSGSNPPF
jgi:RHS repeat-associated protein